MKATLPKFCSTIFKLLFFSLILSSCSGGLEQTEYQKIRKANAIEEKIYRLHSDRFLEISKPVLQPPNAYPWETDNSANLSYITKEFFRCKGDSSHPSYTTNSKERLFDCTGSARHSLPLKDEEEYVYPILLDLLNYLQNTLKAKVVITCGHRCPQHNRYSDSSEPNRYSKHMIGAEVDFYVKGFEKKPEVVVDLLKEYYQHDPDTLGNKAYTTFKRYTKKDSNVVTPPWFNQEVYIKICKENECRDFDNQHPHPYICIQVREDRKTKSRVSYTWEQAFYSYLRY